MSVVEGIADQKASYRKCTTPRKPPQQCRCTRGRAERYDASWHPRLAARIASHAALQCGHHVLDVACGTGLVALAAAAAIGPTGSVVGVDVTAAMLAVARSKPLSHNLAPTAFVQGDAAALSGVRVPPGTHLPGGTAIEAATLPLAAFDAVTACSALPLFIDPAPVLAEWARYVRPGGVLVVDVPSENSQLVGLVLEQVLKEGGVHVPWCREWVTDVHSLESAVENAGLVVRKSVKEHLVGCRQTVRIADLDDVWERWRDSVPALAEVGSEVEEQLKERWKNRLPARAADGVISDDETFYVVVAEKA